MEQTRQEQPKEQRQGNTKMSEHEDSALAALARQFMKRGLEREAAMRKARELCYGDRRKITLKPDLSSESEEEERKQFRLVTETERI